MTGNFPRISDLLWRKCYVTLDSFQEGLVRRGFQVYFVVSWKKNKKKKQTKKQAFELLAELPMAHHGDSVTPL